MSVGVVGLSEEDAVAAYGAGAKVMDRVPLRIANEANKTDREGRARRRRGS
jgi:hypothetical protein